MKISLKSTEGDLNFEGKNSRGDTIALSGSQSTVSPMESVLMAAAACSAIDVEIFLKKMRQPLKDLQVEVEGTRVLAVPAVFSDIHMHYIVIGDVKTDKAEKAIDMSVKKYCSVSKMLEKAVNITYTFEVRKA